MKILMTTMSLDIGGAETHIIELAKELMRRDGDTKITVASNGGVYVSELESNGIRHVTLPLHTKNLISVIKSYFGLKKLIEAERFDIIHAHARIPAFICGFLAGKYKIRFVTTAHGVYKVTPYWKLLSNWGERALAVSYDVKQYLISEYNMPSDNITMTINGIDVNRFARGVPYSDVVSEFALNTSDVKHRIMYVSRIDRENAHIAFQLAEAAPMLFVLYDDLEIIIVGHGTAFLELARQVSEVNRLLGKEVIKLTGARTDINKFMACADIFIGVSRSALEAMSAELPVILSGSQGYIGIFSEKKLRDALDTNFCCRGFDMSTPKQLYNDITGIFSMSEAERRAMGKYNRSVVIERYSIKRMGDDAVSVYGKVMPYKSFKYGDIILNGYYGFGNMGDDSLLQQIINSMRSLEPDIKITVLSKTPKTTSRIYGVHSVNRFNILSVINLMKHARLLVYGGGNLLQNKTSNRSLLYYIFILKLAKKYNLKTMLYASGIGPLYGRRYRELSKNILNETDLITLRERSSLNELNEIGVVNPNVHITCDPAFFMECANENWIKYVMFREGLSLNKKYFMFAPRNIKDSHIKTPAGLDYRLAEACLQISKRYKLEPVIIPLQPKYDMDICKKIAEHSGGKLISGLSASELAGFTKQMAFVTGMRLHLLIYAMAAGTPVLALDCDPKISALFERVNLPYIIGIEKFTVGKFIDMSGALLNNGKKVSADLLAAVADLRNLALTDAKYALDLLNDTETDS